MQRDQIWRNMVIHLLHALHKDKGSIWRYFILTSFWDCPSFFLRICNSAMVCRDCFQFYLNVSLHWSSQRVNQFCSIWINIDFILNIINIFISAHPSWSRSEMRKIFTVNIVILILRSHKIELFRWSLIWNSTMSCFVKMIMDNFS